MKCYDNYKGDRICGLCEVSNNVTFKKCKDSYDKSVGLREALLQIKRECHYRINCYDEYTSFDGCNKYSNELGRFARECEVTLECENKIDNRKEGKLC